MKSRKRIANDELALAIGLELNKNRQYRLSQEQWRKYFELTLDESSKFFDKVVYDEVMKESSEEEKQNLVSNGILKATQNAEVRVEETKHLWIKKDGASLFVKNPNFKDEYELQLEKIREGILNDAKASSRYFGDFVFNPRKEGRKLLVLSPADVHIGKLVSSFEGGVEYNMQIAVNRVLEGIEGILHRARFEKINQLLLILGNDILHIDNPRRTTTSGTPQDTDGMWYENFLMAKRLYEEIIVRLCKIGCPIHVMYNPSNHDYTHGFFLCQVIESLFSGNKQLTFDVNMSHRKYFLFGKNLIGSTHGDGGKVADLPLSMATEVPHYWAESKYRYIYAHHVHHKVSKDYQHVTVEHLRSPSESDSWHHRNQYNSPKALEGFLHDWDFGQVSRFTHYF